MFNSNMPSLSDIAAVTGNRNNDNFGDGNGWWILIILFALFGGWGNNGWNNSGDARPATQGDVQRGFDTQTVVSKLDGISNGICDGFYAMNSGMLTGFNTLQNSIQQGNFGLQNAIQQNTVANMQNTNALATQLANCCCENREAIAQVRYNMATDTCAITTAINQASQNVMQNCNSNYRALHDEITAIQMAAKDEKIAEQANLINALNMSASQSNQNAYLVEQMKQLVKTGCCGSGC